jgi:hypothetical protein
MKQAKEMDKLILISKQWEKDFKGDLLEGLLQSVEDLKEWLNVFINEWIPIWSEENIELYKDHEEKLLSLNLDKLQQEYITIKGTYECGLELEDEKGTDLGVEWDIEGINNFILDCELDEDRELTLEEIKSIMEDNSYYGA